MHRKQQNKMDWTWRKEKNEEKKQAEHVCVHRRVRVCACVHARMCVRVYTYLVEFQRFDVIDPLDTIHRWKLAENARRPLCRT